MWSERTITRLIAGGASGLLLKLTERAEPYRLIKD